jgi:hypothetical protein
MDHALSLLAFSWVATGKHVSNPHHCIQKLAWRRRRPATVLELKLPVFPAKKKKTSSQKKKTDCNQGVIEGADEAPAKTSLVAPDAKEAELP